jgi:biopolymer transport protein TolR
VRGDRQADYGTVMRVMGRLNAAGYKRIGLVTLEEIDG